MMASHIDIEIRINAAMAQAQLRCLSAMLNPDTPELSRRIERSAFLALCEVQRMGAAAREAIGCAARDPISIEVQLDSTTS